MENHEENVEKPVNSVENTAENVKNSMERLCKARPKAAATADGQGKGGCGKQTAAFDSTLRRCVFIYCICSADQ